MTSREASGIGRSLGVVLCLLIGGAVTGTAQATPGNSYVLDIGRGDALAGQIIEVDHDTGQELRSFTPTGPGVEPLHAPTGIVVDAQGYLIVADQDGYNTQHTIDDIPYLYDCLNGCGAVLRVNPLTAEATVISRGPHWANPSSALLPPDGDLYDDGGGPEDDLLVTDVANSAIFRVAPTGPIEANQTPFYENYGDTDAARRTGLRRPWDIARDPDTNELLVTNVGGNEFKPLTDQPGCDDDPKKPGLSEVDGFVVRMSAAGAIEDYICDPSLKRPRGIVAQSGGRAFVADPLANVGDPTATDSPFAGVFRLEGGDLDLISLGDQLATPSGIDLTYSGNGLLIADESAYPGFGPCVVGCGGLLAVDPEFGDQARYSPPTPAPLFFHNPIDVTVDRGGSSPGASGDAGAVTYFGPQQGSRASAVSAKPHGGAVKPRGVTVFVVDGLGDATSADLSCLPGKCSVAAQTRSVVDGRARFTFRRRAPLQGRFEVAAKHRNLKYGGRFVQFTVKPKADPPVKVDDRGCLAIDPSDGIIECPVPDPL